MDEERLDAFELLANEAPMDGRLEMKRAILELVAEVRRLRAALEGKGDDDEPISIAWLKELKALHDDEGWHLNGLSLAWWDDHWRWQIGGTDNMWEMLHIPTRGMVRRILAALGFDR